MQAEWEVLKEKMVKRTKKEFKDYNEYRDRPFGLKWGTAFAMDELTKGINKNKLEALKDNPPLPLMSREEIDEILVESYLNHKTLSIQLIFTDPFGRILDNVEGMFNGEAYHDYFVIDNCKINWDEVRNIRIKSR